MVEPCIKGRRSLEAFSPNYTIDKKLGRGTFAKVKLATHTLTGNKVAVKILNLQKLEDEVAERVWREIHILGSLSHPHIIRLFEVLKKRSKIYLVMEYMDGGELYDYVIERGRLQEDEARYFFQQIITGVDFCHLNMVAHRDLKLENLLMDSKGNVKLADFGLGNVIRDGHFLKTSCGSPDYAAPEILSGKHYSGSEIDVWSCGVILFVLLCGRYPFDVELPFLVKTIQAGRYTLPSHLSDGARDLIRRILLVDPMTRITISGIRRHPWFEIHLPRRLALPIEEMRKRVNKENTSITMRDNSHEQSYQCDTSRSPGLQHPVRRNWALGLQSLARPIDIMREVLNAMQRLNICWKKIGDYNMKCRWIPNLVSSQKIKYIDLNCPPSDESTSDNINEDVLRSENAIKFEIQLYKSSGNRYLLDLQILSGSPILFLELCHSVLALLLMV